jgi:hypothetical protein
MEDEMKVITQKWITRYDLQQNRDRAYLFGDNLLKTGFGGQAYEMRGERNAVGIPTKKSPGMWTSEFFTDREYEMNTSFIDDAFDGLRGYDTVVIPEDGIGTGLAQMDVRAPKTFAYLQKKIEELKNEN